MAKGRRLTNSRSDRLLGVDSYSYGYNYSHNHNPTDQVSELGEDDVWSMVEESTDHRPHHHQNHHNWGGYGGEWTPRAAVESGRRRAVTNGQDHSHVGGLSLAFDDKTTPSQRILHQFGVTAGGGGGGGPRGGRHMATSAPVNVPDWSKILRVDSVESMHDSDEDDRVGDSGMEPPHEYLARSRKMNARSVFEGVGRTLKGRDMSRVRDAVWSQTGFEG